MPGCGREYSYLPHSKSSNCGKALKLFQPSKSVNTSYGSGNELRYGKIEIDARKEIGNPQPTTLNIKVGSSSTKRRLVFSIIY